MHTDISIKLRSFINNVRRRLLVCIERFICAYLRWFVHLVLDIFGSCILVLSIEKKKFIKYVRGRLLVCIWTDAICTYPCYWPPPVYLCSFRPTSEPKAGGCCPQISSGCLVIIIQYLSAWILQLRGNLYGTTRSTICDLTLATTHSSHHSEWRRIQFSLGLGHGVYIPIVTPKVRIYILLSVSYSVRLVIRLVSSGIYNDYLFFE